MGLLFPIGLIFLALAIPIIIFYLLKVKREDLAVSSSFLWRKVIEDKQANAPWQKLQKNWLLLLQLLLLILFVFILSRPFFTSEARAAGNIVVLLDASAGMQATDIAPNRFEKGKEEVRSLIEGMGNNDKMTLVLMRSYPEVLVSSSSNKGDLRAALEKAKVTSEPVNARGAVTLAAANADRNPGTTVVVVSNGSFARDDTLPPLRAKVSYVKIGTSNENQAITALRVRESGVSPQLYIGLHNYAADAAKVSLEVTINNKPFENPREVDLAAGGKVDLTLVNLPTDSRLITAKITPVGGGKDYLSVDNQAWTVRGAATPQRILVVTTGNTFLETVLKLLPNYKIFQTDPTEFPNLKDRNNYDLYIFDKYSPDVLPAQGGIFMIDPTNSALFPVSATVNTPVITNFDKNDPILRYTEPNIISIAQVNQYEVPTWARVVASDANKVPLIIAGERQGQRVVVMGFNLNNSDLAVSYQFPILLTNVLGWLQPLGAVGTVTEVNPGEPVSFSIGTTNEQITVQPPRGGATILKPTNNVAAYTETFETGVYSVTRRLQATPVAGTAGRPTILNDNFVVNLFSESASKIEPLDELGLQGIVNPGQTTSSVKTEQEFWQYIALVALVLLLLEWYIFYKGFRLPFGKRGEKSTTLKTKGRVG
jgi:Ca-activated chloride channel homolog